MSAILTSAYARYTRGDITLRQFLVIVRWVVED